MAPIQSTPHARTTRSHARKNGAIHHALNAGVHKRFQCIICDKKHGSRAALSRHFNSHTTRPEGLSPFTHPSCWDDAGATHPPSRQRVHDMMMGDDEFGALPSKKQRALNTRIEYAVAGVRSKKQLKQKDEQRRLRVLHWWFRANEESLRTRMEFGPEGLFPRQGERKLEDQGQAFYVDGITAEDDSLLKLADAPAISQLESLSAASAPRTRADYLVSNPDQAALSISAAAGLLDHDFDRSLTGSFIAEFKLASTRPLTSMPLLWCISTTLTHFVAAHGEDIVCAIALKRATEIYLHDVGVSQDIVNQLNAHFDHTIIRQYDSVDDQSDDEEKWASLLHNEKRFRKDRWFIWTVLKQATLDYFIDYEDAELAVSRRGARHSSAAVKVVVRATRAFVSRLGDEETAAYVGRYWKGRI